MSGKNCCVPTKKVSALGPCLGTPPMTMATGNNIREGQEAAATCAGPGAAMPKCPKCDKEVYFAERVTSLGKDWHRPCLKCEKCGKTLTSGGHAEHEGKPYCNHPCYSAMFGPKGFGRGGAESHTFK
ncbi:rCG27793, isoform CRA_c [Rattus norvegicus]|uniref:Cysteine-rich protein 1 n=1 Tax=Rattus norvegicus TaxID=10116 RepID=A6KBY9_RAT|nr:rCG27793, isoform CRA_c [Rattus norvegicus]